MFSGGNIFGLVLFEDVPEVDLRVGYPSIVVEGGSGHQSGPLFVDEG